MRRAIVLAVAMVAGCGGPKPEPGPALGTRVGKTAGGAVVSRVEVEGGCLYVVEGYNRLAVVHVPNGKD